MMLPQVLSEQKRPPDAISGAVHIAMITTGKIKDTELRQPDERATGLAGAKACPDSPSVEDRAEIAQLVAEVRWQK